MKIQFGVDDQASVEAPKPGLQRARAWLPSFNDLLKTAEQLGLVKLEGKSRNFTVRSVRRNQ